MSRSQFHSIKLFILRHAWLNLWDKHMTTGRINQVTVLSTPTERPPKRLRLNMEIHTTKAIGKPATSGAWTLLDKKSKCDRIQTPVKSENPTES